MPPFFSFLAFWRKRPATTPTMELGRLLSNLWSIDEAVLPALEQQVRELLEKGADPSAQYGRDRIWQLAVNYPAMLQILLDTGRCDLSSLGAVEFRDDYPFESLLLMLRSGLEPNLVSADGESLVHFLWERFDEDAGEGDTREALQLALKAGADPALLHEDGGYRPFAPSVEVDHMLIAVGAKPNQQRRKPQAVPFEKGSFARRGVLG